VTESLSLMNGSCYTSTMKLIFIYGPPASGKLTIAEKLSELTNIPMFHNHLSRDLVKDIYKEDLLKHYDLVDKIRFDVLEYCVLNNTDLIFTYVYGGSFDDENVKNFIDKIEKNGGTISFVELTATRKDLIARVGNESRRKYKKLTDKSVLKELTKTMDAFHIPFVKSLRINTSKLSADDSAELIVKELQLNS